MNNLMNWLNFIYDMKLKTRERGWGCEDEELVNGLLSFDIICEDEE